MITQESIGGIGIPTFLLTNSRQHRSEDLADALAKEIFNTESLAGDRAIDGEAVRDMIARVLVPSISDAIHRERELLDTYERQCTTDYGVAILVTDALKAIHALPEHDWTEKLQTPEWTNAAMFAIGNILATAIHIERSWFAVDHPENEAAQSYTSRFTG